MVAPRRFFRGAVAVAVLGGVTAVLPSALSAGAAPVNVTSADPTATPTQSRVEVITVPSSDVGRSSRVIRRPGSAPAVAAIAMSVCSPVLVRTHFVHLLAKVQFDEGPRGQPAG